MNIKGASSFFLRAAQRHFSSTIEWYFSQTLRRNKKKKKNVPIKCLHLILFKFHTNWSWLHFYGPKLWSYSPLTTATVQRPPTGIIKLSFNLILLHEEGSHYASVCPHLMTQCAESPPVMQLLPGWRPQAAPDSPQHQKRPGPGQGSRGGPVLARSGSARSRLARGWTPRPRPGRRRRRPPRCPCPVTPICN